MYVFIDLFGCQSNGLQLIQNENKNNTFSFYYGGN